MVIFKIKISWKLEKSETVLNKSTGRKAEAPVNILKNLFRSRFFCQYVTVAYDFNTVPAKLYQAELKLQERRGKRIKHKL